MSEPEPVLQTSHELDAAIDARAGSPSKLKQVHALGAEVDTIDSLPFLENLFRSGIVVAPGPLSYSRGVIFRGTPQEVIARVASVPPYEAKGTPHKILVKMVALACTKLRTDLAALGGSWAPKTVGEVRLMASAAGPLAALNGPGEPVQSPAAWSAAVGISWLTRANLNNGMKGVKPSPPGSFDWRFMNSSLRPTVMKLRRPDVTDQVLQDAVDLMTVREVQES